MLYEVNIEFEGFSGTLDLLVERVRRFEIDIVDVRLSKVARQVAETLGREINLNLFGPFLTVSKLMFVKSRNLLPGQDQFEDTELEKADREQQEEEETQVRMRLEEQYRAFSNTGQYLKELIQENNKMLRSYQTRRGELPEFIDEIAFLEEVTPFDLMITMNQIIRRSLQDNTYRVKVDDAQLLTRRISEVFDFVLSRRESRVTFDDIRAENPDRPEVALSFLALVYLVSRGSVHAFQQTPYGEITIRIASTDRRQLQNADA